MKGNGFFLFWQQRCYFPRVPQLAGIILGMMLLWLPANAQQSSSSDEHLMTWTQLSSRFDETLKVHDQTLSELSTKLVTSELNGARLNDLSTLLSRQNEDLKNYNQQIGERMQERDEDLSSAYDRINALEKADLKHWIAHIIMGLMILIPLAIKICRFLRIIPL